MSEEAVQKQQMTKKQRITLIVLASVAAFLILAMYEGEKLTTKVHVENEAFDY